MVCRPVERRGDLYRDLAQSICRRRRAADAQRKGPGQDGEADGKRLPTRAAARRAIEEQRLGERPRYSLLAAKEAASHPPLLVRGQLRGVPERHGSEAAPRGCRNCPSACA